MAGWPAGSLRRVAEHADGWMPNRVTPAQVEDSRARLDALAAERGRDPASLTITVYGQEPRRDVVQPFLDAGADRVVVRPDFYDSEESMNRELERMATAVLP